MKPPRFASVFEGLINAIACQQLTLTVGIRLLNRLARACGTGFDGGGVVAHAFPRPEDLVNVSPATLRALGFSRQKGRAILELARSVAEGTLDLELLSALPDEAAVARLRELRGVGRWTAEYVLLRGLGRVHVFPGTTWGPATTCSPGWGCPSHSITTASAGRCIVGGIMADCSTFTCYWTASRQPVSSKSRQQRRRRLRRSQSGDSGNPHECIRNGAG